MNKVGKWSAGLLLVITAIINTVIVVEGGYSDNPADPGGKTMYGVTEQAARAYGYKGDMANLTKEEASLIYAEVYVARPGFDKVIALSTAVGHKVVDAGVNTGPTKSITWLQSSLNSLNRNGKDFPDLKIDGVLGANTVSAYQTLQRIRGRAEACKLVIKLVDAQQAAYYMSLKHLRTFTVGWISHRIGNVPLERCNDDTIKSI